MLKDLLKKPGVGLLLGVGAVLLAPLVLPALARLTRPLAKAALHGYFAISDGLKGLAEDADQQSTPVIDHLVAAGVEEAATVAGEEAVDDGVVDAIVEGITVVLEEV
jgi:hypothetical protein